MDMYNPIQQDWLSELIDGVNDRVNDDTSAVSDAANAVQSDTPFGATLPLFAEPEHNKLPVAKGAERHQLHQQLRGSWVRAVGQSSNPSKLEVYGHATEVADPVLEHLNSAMDLAYSLRTRSPKRSYRQSKTTGVLICQHLVAALKLTDDAQHVKS